ncbi:MAG: DUF4864 domain-containing protein [Kiloniellales bacterium]|nr:DUF4864 domain-containing protein [Kiloniellales bacterium]
MATKILSLITALFLALGGTALAQEASSLDAAERGAIRKVIESQLAAFQRDDAAGAFAFASPKIQEMFGDPATFMTMVRSGYQPVYRPRRFEFQDVRDVQGQPAQEVFFVGPDGGEVLGIYIMDQQPDGRWRIDGVYLVKPEDTGA